MYIWLALLIPVIAVIILYIFFSKKIAWWESGGIILIVLSFIAIMKYGTEISQTSDTEYIQDYVVRVEYYEEWDEWITQTCTRSCCCDSKGENCGSEPYDCSYRDYHPEYWVMITSQGQTYTISREMWVKLMIQFKATPVFADMDRDFYTIDGNMYYFLWNKDVNSIEYVTNIHNYENRIQAAHTVLNYPLLDDAHKKIYKVNDYPTISNLEANALLGETNYDINKYINQTNALFAAKKQVKVFYLVYRNLPVEAAIMQEQYWKGGNKNELNICIGIDNNRNIKWAYVFSWTKKEIVKVQIRDYINSQKVLNDSIFKNIINYSNKEIIDKFERRHFREFSYLTVEPTKTAVIWTYIISFIITIGLSIWVINNGIDSDGFSDNTNYNFYNKYKNL